MWDDGQGMLKVIGPARRQHSRNDYFLYKKVEALFTSEHRPPLFFYTQYCRKPDGARLEINHVITNDGFSEEDSKIAS